MGSSEYRINFKDDSDKRRWAELLANIHKNGYMEINGFDFDKPLTVDNLMTEFQTQHRVSLKVRSGMLGVMFSPDMPVYKTTLEKLESKGYTVNSKDFESLRDHIDGWFNCGLQPYVVGSWDENRTYSFEGLLYLVMKIGQTMDNFYMFPVPSTGTIAVCGTFNRELGPDDYWYKDVTVRTEQYTNCSPGYYFDADDGFAGNRYGDKGPQEMTQFNTWYHALAPKDQTFENVRNKVNAMFMVVE